MGAKHSKPAHHGGGPFASGDGHIAVGIQVHLGNGHILDHGDGRLDATNRAANFRVAGHIKERELISRGVHENIAQIENITVIKIGNRRDTCIAAADHERIVAAAAGQRVVAVTARERVIARIADQRIVKCRAGDVLDRCQGIGRTAPIRCRAGAKVDIHTGAVEEIGDRIGAGTTVYDIGTGAAGQNVISGIADQDVVPRTAVQEVRQGPTGERVYRRCRAPWYPPSDRPPNAIIAMIDENPHAESMTYQSHQADMYLEGNVAQTLRDLAQAAKANDLDTAAIAARRETLTAAHDELVEKKKAQRIEARQKKLIDPLWLCEAMNNALPDGTIYVDEVTTHTGLLRRHLDWNQPQSLFTRRGGLGQGLGLSLGVKLAKPDRPVVTLIGDGAFLYNPALGALGAARDYKLPTLTVIFNNKKYATMQGMHLQMYPDGAAVDTDTYHGTHINAPDFAKIAESFGAYGEQVTDPEDLEAALQRGLAATGEGRSAILDVIIGDHVRVR